ncbi:semaphorin-4A [Labrus bergylta]|uniref:Semaphorin-4A-like n=1 Tax=Labrus bergylta TaxID=56723 RepID=A0A3Q3H1X3_9LABR|nr:semaphorin-4A-like [Labrus bergylta]
MAPSVLVLVLVLLDSSASLPPPRKTFLLNSADRPLLLFSLPDIQNTTTLLLSDDASTLYVGARDAVLSLDVSQSDIISLKNKVQWSPSDSETSDCKYKVKNPSVDCPNFVSVLQLINSTHLYACGSYAYSPHDAFIDTGSFSMVQPSSVRTKTRCPHNPFQRSTAISHDGELFTATTTDFKGEKPQISRHFSKDGRPDVSLDSFISLLQEPTFVSSSLDLSDRKLYFFFSEVGKEFRFVDELHIARVAQVCKDDVGGQRTLQRKWTSFAKAPLLCQLPKQLPFNVLQDVFTLPPPEGNNASDTLFYGVFTSQWSSVPESAVCVFKLQDIRNVFRGNYMTLNTQSMQWSQRQGRPIQRKCGLETASDTDLEEVKNSFLTSRSVTPVGNAPVMVSSEQQYSRVAAMRTQAANGKQYTVLFLLTDSGFLHKVALFDRGARVVEEIQVFTEPQPVKSLILSSEKGVLYLGTSEGVTAVPVTRCSIYTTCSQCVLSRDPLCGWSRSSRVCTRVEDNHEDMAQDLEHGNVEEKCQGQTETSQDQEINVQLNEAVKLFCQKPSNPSALTWTSTRFNTLPEDLFIRPADGSLMFLATADTTGTYRCEAVEDGHREVVVSFNIQLSAAPRSMRPSPKEDREPVPYFKNEPTLAEEPIKATTKTSDPERPTIKDEEDEFKVAIAEVTNHSKDNSDKTGFDKTSRKDSHSLKEPLDGAPTEKSYFSELVVVSLLLVVCICLLALGGLHVWHQSKSEKKNPLVSPGDDSKTIQSMESVPSLSSPEDADPELKVVQ